MYLSLENILVLIPARGGSKGLPDKNIKNLAGKPLIQYTLEAAMSVFPKKQICVSTDSTKIAGVAEDVGLDVPFLRPAELATDNASSRDVILHALDFYADGLQTEYPHVLLLQPTSPFRTAQHINEALESFKRGDDLVASVKVASANPYYTLFEENEAGFLNKSKEHNATRRQDLPAVWEFNGALYIFDSESVKRMPISEFTKIRKYIMDEYSSVDIDTPLDWTIAESLIQQLKG